MNPIFCRNNCRSIHTHQWADQHRAAQPGTWYYRILEEPETVTDLLDWDEYEYSRRGRRRERHDLTMVVKRRVTSHG